MIILFGTQEGQDIRGSELLQDAKVPHIRETCFTMVIRDGLKNNGIRADMLLVNLEKILDPSAASG